MEETKEDRVKYKIYKITCNETKEVYFGKTTKTLEQRLYHHVKALSCSSKQIIERGKYRIEQIDSTFDEEESKILERRYIENNECVNVVVPGRTKKEWDEEHKEEISEYMKEYREEHKEEISEYKKKYREEHKEEMSEYMKEYNKKYHEEHKDEIREKRKEKYTCECGSTLRKDDKARHEKTQRHINYMNSKK